MREEKWYSFNTCDEAGIVQNYETVRRHVEGKSNQFKKFYNREDAVSFLVEKAGAEFVAMHEIAAIGARSIVVSKWGYWGVRTRTGGGVFSSKKRMYQSICESEIIACQHFATWRDAHAFAYQWPMPPVEQFARSYKLNSIY